jgi:hypothetical protein
MWSHAIVMLALGFDDDSSFAATAKPPQAQTSITQLAVERFLSADLARATKIDVRSIDADILKPPQGWPY